MSTLVIKTNASRGTDVLIEDVGIEIPASGGLDTFTDSEEISQFQRSEDLIAFLSDDVYGAAEVRDVTAAADTAGSLDGLYFTLDTPAAGYYVWMNVASGGNDPGPIGARIAVPVAVGSNDVDTVVAASLQSALDALGDVTATVTLAVVTVANDISGAVIDAVDVNSGFTVAAPSTAGTDSSTLILNDGSTDIAQADALAFLANVLLDNVGHYAILQAGSAGDYVANQQSITDLPAPTAADHATNKAYVDSLVGGSARRWLTFSSERRVPPNGKRFLEIGGVSTAAAPLVVPRAGTLTAATISVNNPDASNTYKLSVKKNGAEVESIVLNTGTVKQSSVSFIATYLTEDEISISVERTAGSGRSDFDEISAMVEFQDS